MTFITESTLRKLPIRILRDIVFGKHSTEERKSRARAELCRRMDIPLSEFTEQFVFLRKNEI